MGWLRKLNEYPLDASWPSGYPIRRMVGKTWKGDVKWQGFLVRPGPIDEALAAMGKIDTLLQQGLETSLSEPLLAWAKEIARTNGRIIAAGGKTLIVPILFPSKRHAEDAPGEWERFGAELEAGYPDLCRCGHEEAYHIELVPKQMGRGTYALLPSSVQWFAATKECDVSGCGCASFAR